MSDAVPVIAVASVMSVGMNKRLTSNSTSPCQQQQQAASAVHHGGTQERRRTDTSQFRPTPVPGPGRGSEPTAEPAVLAEGGSRGDVPRNRNSQVEEDGWRRRDFVSAKFDVCHPNERHQSKSGSEFDKNGKKIDREGEVLYDHDVTTPRILPGKRADDATTSSLLKPGPVRQLQRSCSGSSSDSGCSACTNQSSTIKELYIENESLRIRVKGIEAIVNVLKDTREELESEKGKNAKLNIAVNNLQSRLHQAGFDTSVDLAENEIFIPGHDRSFMNGLISENERLQRLLNDLKRNWDVGTNVVELEKTSEEQKKQLQKLQQELSLKESEISRLESLLRSSDDAKTSRIIHLQDEIDHTSKDLKDVEETCRTLTAETRRFQQDLAASRNQLSQTLKELATLKEKAQDLEKKASEFDIKKIQVQTESKLSTADKLKIASGQVEQLDKENSRLTDQLREVILMNTRWQHYNEQRETHVLKLTKTNQHQQSKITVLEQQRRDLEQTINGLNVMLQTFKDEKRKHTDAAILSLEQQLVQREDRITELAEELSALRGYLQSSESERGVRQTHEDQSMIRTLQQQVKIYKDDFDQERKDRERIQGNVDVLKHKLKDSTRKLQALEHQNTYRHQAVYEPPRRLVARGLPQRGYQDDELYLTSNVEVDAVDETDGAGPSSNTEPLQCPICAQEFDVSDHNEFMQHVGVCLDQ